MFNEINGQTPQNGPSLLGITLRCSEQERTFYALQFSQFKGLFNGGSVVNAVPGSHGPSMYPEQEGR